MSTIQWFPGHMAKAKRQVEEKLRLIDVVIELLDARLPLSSRNPMIDEIVGEKPRLIVLNKMDLADPHQTDQWIQYFKDQGQAVMKVDAQSGTGVHQISAECKRLAQDLIAKRVAKGMQPRAIRIVILGIPNVGKSALINRLVKRHVAKTGDRPGITKAQQWNKVGKELELLDTPGILWPKFDDPSVGLRLAASGAIKDEILHVQDVALFAVQLLQEEYPERIKERFRLEYIPDDPLQLLAEIGRKRGCLQSGGRIDYDKASEMILRELRSGQLGAITFEKVTSPSNSS